MKKNILASLVAFAVTGPAVAADYTTDANIVDHYTTQTRQIPSTELVCNTVEVPIYGTVQGQASTGDALAGAIIGGVIGNQIGNGSGRDAATVLGAIVGADVANKRGSQQQVITGYRQEERCNRVTTYTTSTEEVYSHSTVTWVEGGRTFSLRFKR